MGEESERSTNEADPKRTTSIPDLEFWTQTVPNQAQKVLAGSGGRKTRPITWENRMKPFHDALIRRLVTENVDPQKQLRVVVVGIGNKGAPTCFDLLRDFKEKGFSQVSVLGMDNNTQCVEEAEAGRANADSSNALAFVAADLFDLNTLETVGANGADVVVSSNVLMYYEEPGQKQKALDALRGVVREGGLLALADGPTLPGSPTAYDIYRKEGANLILQETGELSGA